MAPPALSRNIVSNVVARIWTIAVTFALVPVLVAVLGTDSYGLVSLAATLQVAASLLGLGLGKTLRREFARESGSGADQRRYVLMRNVELVYAGIGMVVIIATWCASSALATRWLDSSELGAVTVEVGVRLMAISVVAQLMASIYQGALYGLELQVRANVAQIVWGTVRAATGVVIVMFVAPGVVAYLATLAVVDVVYAVVLRGMVVRVLRRSRGRLAWKLRDLSGLRTVVRFASGVFIISAGHALATQVDKVVISGTLTLTDLAAYSTVSNLGLALALVPAAAGVAVFPRFSRLHAQGDEQARLILFTRVNRAVAIFVSALGLFMGLFAKDLLLVWTRNEDLARIGGSVAFFVCIGYLLLELQVLPFEYLLSEGTLGPNMLLTAFTILFAVTATPWAVLNFGLRGAALAWLGLCVVGTLGYLAAFLVSVCPKGSRWAMVKGTLLPLLVLTLCATGTRLALDHMMGLTALQRVGAAVIAGALALSLTLWLFDRGFLMSLAGMRRVRGSRPGE